LINIICLLVCDLIWIGGSTAFRRHYIPFLSYIVSCAFYCVLIDRNHFKLHWLSLKILINKPMYLKMENLR